MEGWLEAQCDDGITNPRIRTYKVEWWIFEETNANIIQTTPGSWRDYLRARSEH